MDDNLIKICFLSCSWALPVPAYKGGGIETLLTLLAEKNEKKRQYNFIYISPDDVDSVEMWDNSTFYHCSADNNGDMYPYEYKARQIVIKEKPDLLIMEGFASRVDGYFRDLFSRDRMGIHIHNHYPRYRVYQEAFGFSIAVSNYIAKEWREGAIDRNNDQIYVLPNAIHSQLYGNKISQDEKKSIRNALGFSDNDFVVMYCGRLMKEKGISELLDAIITIEDKEIKLLVIGTQFYAKGNNDDFSKRIVKKMNERKDKIKYMGYVENSNLPNIYQSSDMLVIPSLLEESAGLVALEGMASGLPIVYTNSGGMPEYFNKDGGIMIDKGIDIIPQIVDKILWIKNMPVEARRMGNIARKHANEYNESRYYSDFSLIINDWMNKICC